MSKLRDIKRRTTSIEKIRKITGALEIVALTRLKRSESSTLEARFYSDRIMELLSEVAKNINYKKHPLFTKQKGSESVCIICITSDKGLCGNFNNSVFQNFLKFSDEKVGKKKIVAIGKKGLQFFNLRKEFEVIYSFVEISSQKAGSRRVSSGETSYGIQSDLHEEANRISEKLIDSYTKGELAEVYLIFNKFKLQLLGESKILKLLPMEFETEQKIDRDYIYEPDNYTVFDKLLVEFMSNQIYHGVLESKCAEEMARMIAMKQATENADEMIDEFTLKYHKERQKVITRELLDIVNAIS